MENNNNENGIKRSEKMSAKGLYMAQSLAVYLKDLEKDFGNEYDEGDRRAEEVDAIRDGLCKAIEAAARLYAYELESMAFIAANK